MPWMWLFILAEAPLLACTGTALRMPPQMFLDDACHRFARGQATAYGPGIPLPPHCRFQRAGSQHLERTLPFAREIAQVG